MESRGSYEEGEKVDVISELKTLKKVEIFFGDFNFVEELVLILVSIFCFPSLTSTSSLPPLSLRLVLSANLIQCKSVIIKEDA